ncbi:MAG TPA: hypothetical protein VGF97_04060 [Rhizomicrobium sp.]|jgi:hypothetical protein
MKTEHLSTDKQPKNKEEQLDNELRDSFPTSDPPSHTPGAVGAPKNRESEAVTSDDPAVLSAEEKVKSGEAKKPHTY